MRRTLLQAAIAAVLATPCWAAANSDPADTRLLHSPAVSKDHVAFIYARRPVGLRPRRQRTSGG